MPLSTHSAAQLLSARRLLAVSRLGGALTQGDPDLGATDEPDGTSSPSSPSVLILVLVALPAPSSLALEAASAASCYAFAAALLAP